MGRSLQTLAPRRARGAVAAAVGLATLLVVPALAAAHPLGNFTINHYAEVRIEPGRVVLDVVIDQAEIAAFQSRQDFDIDADGSVSDEEIDQGRVAACERLAPDLRLSAGEGTLELRSVEAGLSFPPGVVGLSTMRLVCGFEAPLDEPVGTEATRIAFRDESYPNRLGWREIVVRGSGVTIVTVEGEARDESVSARLTAYPEELIALPLADQRVVVDVTAGGPELAPLDIPDAAALDGAAATAEATPAPSPPVVSATPGTSPTPGVDPVPGGIDGGELPGVFAAADLTLAILLLSLLTAAALGAGHALTPGHGKTLMAAYLVGTRGTPLHAIGLGLSVSLSHTVGVLVLAGIVLGASDLLHPDIVVRWAPVVAAISIVVIGGWMLAGELRRRRSARLGGARTVGHDHAQVHAHGDHGHDHDHHGHGHGHDHHALAPGSTITWRSLFALGLAGGLIPSTSALLILLGSIAAGRPAFGFVLVVAFGLGMAVVMGGIGLVIVAARGRLDRLPARHGIGRLRETVPLVAAMLVFGFGLVLTVQAIAAAPTF
jgi:ABC-type nickel/cobalt efflux system permease component RcnA